MTQFPESPCVTPRLSILVAALLTGALATGCDDPPARPTSIPEPTPTPQSVVTSLELTGPTTIAPGATSEFRLIAVFADGTRTDVTSSAQWSTRNSAVVAVEGQGRVRAGANGDTTLDARYNQRNVSREIVVVPDGTFRVLGRILELDGVTPVANAHIRVRDAEGTGPSTTADDGGFYRLYGVKPRTFFVVTGAGYDQTERPVTIDRHSAINISVALSEHRLNVAGTYTVTFDWLSCGDEFRADLRRRVYTAVVKQSAAIIEVQFTEPEFVRRSATRQNLIRGRVQPTGIYLEAEPDYYYPIEPGYSSLLIEILPDNYFLTIWGRAFLAQSGRRFSGAFSGSAWLYRQGQTDFVSPMCTTGNVSFEQR